MNNQTRFQICCHEAGHAVISHILKARRVESLHVFNDTCGFVSMGPMILYKNRRADVRDKYENLIIYLLAGVQAGDKAKMIPWTIVGNPPAHISTNTPTATKYRAATFTKMIKGTDAEAPPDAREEERLAKKIYPESYAAFLYWLSRRARAIVEKHWPTILPVAALLFHQDHVSRQEFLSIIRRKL